MDLKILAKILKLTDEWMNTGRYWAFEKKGKVKISFDKSFSGNISPKTCPQKKHCE